MYLRGITINTFFVAKLHNFMCSATLVCGESTFDILRPLAACFGFGLGQTMKLALQPHFALDSSAACHLVSF